MPSGRLLDVSVAKIYYVYFHNEERVILLPAIKDLIGCGHFDMGDIIFQVHIALFPEAQLLVKA